MKQTTGIKWLIGGVESEVVIERYRAIYPYEHMVTKVIAEPTVKGKKSAVYQEFKRELGDDWSTDMTNDWFDVKYPHVLVEAIHNALYVSEIYPMEEIVIP